MLTRTISGIIGAILVIMVLFFNASVPLIINALIALVCILSMNELFCAMGLKKRNLLAVPSLLFAGIVPLAGTAAILLNGWYIYTLVVFAILIFYYETISFKNVTMIYTLSLIITFSLTSLIMMRNETGRFGTFYILLALCTPWMADTGAYFCGSLFGKRKLCPKISPKKTVEGALGGLIISALSVLMVCFIFDKWVFGGSVQMNYLLAAGMAAVGSIISIIGDLSFSVVKRGCHIKDFGNVIPGHGGILDRIDSVIFVAPYVYFFIKTFPLLSA